MPWPDKPSFLPEQHSEFPVSVSMENVSWPIVFGGVAVIAVVVRRVRRWRRKVR